MLDTCFCLPVGNWWQWRVPGRLVKLKGGRRHKPTRGEQVVLVGDVSLGSGNTPFLYLGDWLGWIALAGYIFFVVFQTVTERRAKKAAKS